MDIEKEFQHRKTVRKNVAISKGILAPKIAIDVFRERKKSGKRVSDECRAIPFSLSGNIIEIAEIFYFLIRDNRSETKQENQKKKKQTEISLY